MLTNFRRCLTETNVKLVTLIKFVDFVCCVKKKKEKEDLKDVLNVLSHWPGWAAAERGQVFLLLLHLQHQHQAGILILQEVQQEGHEVVDDVGLVALSACVYVNGYPWVFQSNPLQNKKNKQVNSQDASFSKQRTGCICTYTGSTTQ